MTGVYVVFLYSFPGVLMFFFGKDFVSFRSIIVPIGMAQLLMAPTFGLTLFLKAQERGRTLLWLVTTTAFLRLTFTVSSDCSWARGCRVGCSRRRGFCWSRVDRGHSS